MQLIEWYKADTGSLSFAMNYTKTRFDVAEKYINTAQLDSPFVKDDNSPDAYCVYKINAGLTNIGKREPFSLSLTTLLRRHLKTVPTVSLNPFFSTKMEQVFEICCGRGHF